MAVLLSWPKYNRLAARPQSFWAAYTAFAQATNLRHLKIDPQVFEDMREHNRERVLLANTEVQSDCTIPMALSEASLNRRIP
jgi:hypothetical protein